MSDRERLIEAMVKAMMNVVYAGEHRNANDPAYVPLDAQKLATAALDAALPILVEVSEEALLQGVDALYVDSGDIIATPDLERAWRAMIREKLG